MGAANGNIYKITLHADEAHVSIILTLSDVGAYLIITFPLKGRCLLRSSPWVCARLDPQQRRISASRGIWCNNSVHSKSFSW